MSTKRASRSVCLCVLAQALSAQVLVVHVTDPSGAAIPGADVTVDGRGVSHSAVTAATGHTRIVLSQPGPYTVRACSAGFECVSREVRVADREPRVTLALPLAGVRQRVEVTAESDTIALDSGSNQDVLALDPAMLDRLPVLGGDVLGMLGDFVDAGSVGSGGVSVLIDGLESNETKISPADIEEIRINQSPYSAEFNRPGRGRVEIPHERVLPSGTATFAPSSAILNSMPGTPSPLSGPANGGRASPVVSPGRSPGTRRRCFV
jgi:hypothetical protein